MSEPSPAAHPTARLVLDYLRTLLWPALIVWAFLAFKGDMLEILKTREVEVAGAFKIGKHIEDLNRNTQAELEDLRRLAAELQANAQEPERVREVGEAVATRLEALERDFTREVAQLRLETLAPGAAGLPEQAAQPIDPREQARELERLGFEQLLRRDLAGARKSFAGAVRAWPEYHNVAEIERLLRADRQGLAAGGDAAWQELYRTILTRYSWGMPAAAREAMQQALRAEP